MPGYEHERARFQNLLYCRRAISNDQIHDIGEEVWDIRQVPIIARKNCAIDVISAYAEYAKRMKIV